MARSDYFMVPTIYAVVIAVLLFNGGHAVAVDNSERSNAVYNKIKLFDWLVNDSPLSKRIGDDDDEAVKMQLKRAQEMLEQAVEHNDRDEYDLAEVHIDEGLKIMTGVSRKVKDIDRVTKARIQLYKQVKHHVDMFVTAFDRIAEEKGSDYTRDMLDREKLDAVMASADSEFANGDLAMANHLMRQAADMVDKALSDARHEEVLYRELSFDSLEQEYAHEVQRNESYVMLIDLMQKKTAPSQASAAYVKNIIDENARLRKQAEAHVQKGNVKQGITVLEKGTDKLSRALRVSGASF